MTVKKLPKLNVKGLKHCFVCGVACRAIRVYVDGKNYYVCVRCNR